MEFLVHPSTISIVLHITFVIVTFLRITMRRPGTGTTLAWLLLVTTIPLFGVVFYFLIGERRIGRMRSQGIDALKLTGQAAAHALESKGHYQIDWSSHNSAAIGMNHLGQRTTGISAVCGNGFELFCDTQKILKALVKDIDTAQTSVLMEFYIWNQGGTADEVLEALIRAANRGVKCWLLVDALGARPWWKGKQPQKLRNAGINVLPALPVGLFRTFVGRTDLRLHRKIVVIDGKIGWTGSMNLVDPRFFKQDSGVGEWVDAMTRLKGPVVSLLAAIMLGDWALETNERIEDLIRKAGLLESNTEAGGSTDIQVVPSGPSEIGDGLLQMILSLVNAAKKELVLTTPYLVPDESLLRALRGAAERGVDVLLILPKRVDSFLTRYASQSYYEELLLAGVSILQYREGLLHTKSITVDGSMSMFGTVNLDMRSLWLNYEVALFFYGEDFSKVLRALQQTYIEESDRLDSIEWAKRSYSTRVTENTFRLFAPLL